jgi:hypothetical protein
MVVDVTDPDFTFVVEIGDRVVVRNGDGDGDVRLTGDAVDVLEALSIRRPFTQHLPPGSAWMLMGLSETFDTSS